MECPYCLNTSDIEIKISAIETKCKYHKKTGAIYPPGAFTPRGLCPALFYSSYAQCLAVLYSGSPRKLRPRAKGIKAIEASCPHAQGIKVKIKYADIFPWPLRIIKELLEEFSKLLFRPIDAHFRKVIIEIIASSPNCPRGYKEKDKFEFNTGKKNELCPAGFASIYPYLRMKGFNSLKVHCPDYKGVVYDITRAIAPDYGEK